MEQAMATILACIITGIASTVVAIINSNAQRKVTEQKVADTLEAIQKEYNGFRNPFDGIGVRLDELSETDSCCTQLKGDVQDIKENVETMSATLNQFKAKSDEFDDKLQDAFKAIAKDRISQGHRYFMQKGYITESSKESMHAIFVY